MSTELSELMVPDLASALDGYDPLTRHRSYPERTAGNIDPAILLYLDLKTGLEIWHRMFLDRTWSRATAATPPSVGMSA